MIGAVVQNGLHADHRIFGKGAGLHAVEKSLFDRREEVLRHGAADDFLGKFQTFRLAGFKADPHVAELAVSAGLLLVAALNLHSAADGFAVGDAGLFGLRVGAEFILELGDDDVDVLFALTADDHLIGLGVGAEVHGGIFLGQT